MPRKTSNGDSRRYPTSDTGDPPTPGSRGGLDDPLFRRIFGSPENVVSILRAGLTTYEDDRLDLERTIRVPTTFIDEELKDRYSDLLFTALFEGHDAYVYVLVEEQSVSEAMVIEHMTRFVFRICNRHLEENPQAWRVPIVIPRIFGDGSDRAPEPQDAEESFYPGTDAMQQAADSGMIKAFNGKEEGSLREELDKLIDKANARIEAMTPAKAADLIQVLDAKFGPLPERLPQTLRESSIAVLEKCHARAETASTLAEVFEPTRTRTECRWSSV